MNYAVLLSDLLLGSKCSVQLDAAAVDFHQKTDSAHILCQESIMAVMWRRLAQLQLLVKVGTCMHACMPNPTLRQNAADCWDGVTLWSPCVMFLKPPLISLASLALKLDFKVVHEAKLSEYTHYVNTHRMLLHCSFSHILISSSCDWSCEVGLQFFKSWVALNFSAAAGCIFILFIYFFFFAETPRAHTAASHMDYPH